MSECVYGCQKDGTPCPRPHTCHVIGLKKAAEEQAKTDRQCCTGNCRQGRDCTEQDSSWNLVDFLIIVGAVAIIGLVLAPYAAGYLSHMR